MADPEELLMMMTFLPADLSTLSIGVLSPAADANVGCSVNELARSMPMKSNSLSHFLTWSFALDGDELGGVQMT
jgi:hypothetical protein